MALTLKRKRFGDEYLIDGNGTQAAIRAGFSPKTAYSQASRLLKDVEVREYIRARKAELDAEYEIRIMGKYEVMARLTEIAKSDIGDLLGKDDQGNVLDDTESISLKRAKEMGKSHLVKKVETYTTTTTNGEFESQTVTVKVEMYSAHEALRDLGKHHVLFTEKHEVSGRNGEAIPIRVIEVVKDKGNA